MSLRKKIKPATYRLMVVHNGQLLVGIPRIYDTKNESQLFDWRCPSAPGTLFFWREQRHLQDLCASWFPGSKVESIKRVFQSKTDAGELVTVLVTLASTTNDVEFGPFAKLYRLLKFIPIAEAREFIREGHPDYEVIAQIQRILSAVSVPFLPLRRVKVDGFEIAFYDTGAPAGSEGESAQSERPLILIHGLGSDMQNFRWNIEHWRKTRRIIALDLPGHGQSQISSVPHTVAMASRCISRAIDALDVQDYDLLGFSLGGYVSSLVAAEHGDRVKHLILLASAGLQSEYLPPKIFKRMSKLLRSRWYPYARPLLFRARYSSFYKRMVPELELFRAEELKKASRPDFRGRLAAYADFMDSVSRTTAREAYSKITAPTFLIHGIEDAIVRCRDSELMARLMHQAEVRKIENCGHMLTLEYYDTVNHWVSEFIETKNIVNQKTV